MGNILITLRFERKKFRKWFERLLVCIGGNRPSKLWSDDGCKHGGRHVSSGRDREVRYSQGELNRTARVVERTKKEARMLSMHVQHRGESTEVDLCISKINKSTNKFAVIKCQVDYVTSFLLNVSYPQVFRSLGIPVRL